MKAKKIVALVLALVMVLALGTSALAATGDMSNPVTVSGVTLRFGDPNYPATAPEKYMYFKETGTGTYDAIYSTDGTTEDASYYPRHPCVLCRSGRSEWRARYDYFHHWHGY